MRWAISGFHGCPSRAHACARQMCGDDGKQGGGRDGIFSLSGQHQLPRLCHGPIQVRSRLQHLCPIPRIVFLYSYVCLCVVCVSQQGSLAGRYAGCHVGARAVLTRVCNSVDCYRWANCRIRQPQVCGCRQGALAPVTRRLGAVTSVLPSAILQLRVNCFDSLRLLELLPPEGCNTACMRGIRVMRRWVWAAEEELQLHSFSGWY